jgi:hypothetical protein
LEFDATKFQMVNEIIHNDEKHSKRWKRAAHDCNSMSDYQFWLNNLCAEKLDEDEFLQSWQKQMEIFRFEWIRIKIIHYSKDDRKCFWNFTSLLFVSISLWFIFFSHRNTSDESMTHTESSKSLLTNQSR